MRDLALIRAVYDEIDLRFEKDRAQASEAADQNSVERIENKQRINDQAYFILCWGQIEADIDEVCRKAIRARLGKPNWADRRGWDLFNPDEKRLSGLSFEDRTALVLDRNAGAGSAWAKLMNYYGLRNSIAHGTLRPDRIDVSAVVDDFYQVQSALSE